MVRINLRMAHIHIDGILLGLVLLKELGIALNWDDGLFNTT